MFLSSFANFDKIKPHDEIPILINVKTLFIHFFHLLAIYSGNVVQNHQKKIWDGVPRKKLEAAT